MTPTSGKGIEGMLDHLVDQVPGAREAVVVSSDGLLSAQSASVDRAEAERLAAVAAMLVSVARAAGEPMRAGDVQEIIINMEHAVLLVMGIGTGSAVAVVATHPCDLGIVAFEMATLVAGIRAL